MKKALCLLMMILCSVSFVSAAESYRQEADSLNRMGLFRGTGEGYQLEKSFTRAEGATMLVRLLGKEDEALAQTIFNHPFEDVRGHWSELYVAYCYANGITKGTGDTTFSPEAQMPADEYITLVLRSLGYANVQPDNADIAAAEYALADSGTVRELFAGSFIRDKMVFASYQALKVKSLSGKTLIEQLIEEGTVSRNMAKELDLLPTNQYIK